MNKNIISQFELLINSLKTLKNKDVKDRFRIINLQNSLKEIKNFPKKINSGKDLKDIPGIGNGTIRRIDEILKTGKLSEIKIPDKNRQKIINNLMDIINIGEKTAEKLVDEYKIKSVEDLIQKYKKGKIILNEKIVLGLKYYKKFEGKIPRKEVSEIIKIFIKYVSLKVDKDLIIVPCGSYRRKQAYSNDIDILIFHPSKEKKDYISKIVYELSKPISDNNDKPLIVDNLTDKGLTKYMGFCQYKNGKIRRIDIRFIPFKSFYPAILYFTGNSKLNRMMRSIAKKKDYLLNEYGLFYNNKMVKIESEKDIFDLLDIKYLKPEDRSI